MADNNSIPGNESFRDSVIIVQILVMFFLCINLLLIVSFFSKDSLYTATRYILFAVTLLSDSLFLIMSDLLLVFGYFHVSIHVGLCITFCFILLLYYFVTPVTLTAMTLERYVAICMPLRHAELCSTRRALCCIFIIHSLSSVPCIVMLSGFFAFATHSFFTQSKKCSVEIFIVHNWQQHLRSAISQFYFLIMFITIVFSYVKIMKVAKAASGEDKKSTWKGLRTVILHAFQLLLCLIQLWCPFIEAAALQVNFMTFINVRFFNYIIFTLTPRCLSPLIYGLRDEMFFHALKNLVLCGLRKKPLCL